MSVLVEKNLVRNSLEQKSFTLGNQLILVSTCSPFLTCEWVQNKISTKVIPTKKVIIKNECIFRLRWCQYFYVIEVSLFISLIMRCSIIKFILSDRSLISWIPPLTYSNLKLYWMVNFRVLPSAYEVRRKVMFSVCRSIHWGYPWHLVPCPFLGPLFHVPFRREDIPSVWS